MSTAKDEGTGEMNRLCTVSKQSKQHKGRKASQQEKSWRTDPTFKRVWKSCQHRWFAIKRNKQWETFQPKKHYNQASVSNIQGYLWTSPWDVLTARESCWCFWEPQKHCSEENCWLLCESSRKAQLQTRKPKKSKNSSSTFKTHSF